LIEINQNSPRMNDLCVKPDAGTLIRINDRSVDPVSAAREMETGS